MGGGVYWAGSALQPKPFDPLDLPQQTVSNTIKGIPGPAVLEGDDVVVTATICNTSATQISITGISVWSEQAPPGDSVELGGRVAQLSPGCVTRVYANAMPAGVMTRVDQLEARGEDTSTWLIEGTRTPIRRGGVPKVWRTDDFTIVAKKSAK